MLTPSNDLSIHGRITVGYLVVTLCLGSIGAVGFWALTVVGDHLNSLKDTGAVNVIAIELERDVVDLQRCVQRYSSTGHKSVESAVEKLIARVDGKLADLRASAETYDLPLITRMQGHLKVYKETFSQAIRERRIRRELVSDKLSSIRTRLEPLLNDSRVNDGLLKKAYLGAEREVYRYLYDPTRDLVATALRTLETEVNRSATMPPEERSLLMEYRETAIRIVQATRGYLHLTGVVMAGEAYEFSHVANELKQVMLARSEKLTDGLLKSSKQVRSFTATLTLIAVLIGMVLPYFISRSISFPLKRITETFRALAAGDDATDIPGRERTDEIGVMAAAADIFMQRNKETERLLEATNALANDLKRKTFELAQSNEELDQFVYTVSHDLKSPVVTAIGFLGMIDDMVANGQVEEALDQLPRIERATHRMSELINDLLDLSRIGRVELEMNPTDLDVLVRELADVFGPTMTERGVTMKLAPGMPTVVACHSRVRQVFENLIGNAIKYTKNDAGAVVAVDWQDARDETLVCVSDNGPGIRPEHHEKAFALFQRLDSTADGTGVGLSVVQRIMKAHGGRVWIDSEGNGDGCRFWLAFPKSSVGLVDSAGRDALQVEDAEWRLSI